LKAPSFAVRKRVGSTEFGAVWFYLDEVIGYPVSIVETGILIVWNSLSTTLYSSRWFYDFSVDQQKTNYRMD
jgi:hypothetical protein